MSNVIVTDLGFGPDDWPCAATSVLDLPGDAVPETLNADLAQITHIRITIPGFADGRGFTLARQLRRMGFEGCLRASGPVIADQYIMARRCGFDEIEIPKALAERQPEADWQARMDWRKSHYQARLQGKRIIKS